MRAFRSSLLSLSLAALASSGAVAAHAAPASHVHAMMSTSSVGVGHTVTVAGTVSRGELRPVQVQEYSSKGWRVLATGAEGRSGTFALKVPALVAGSHTLRAYAPATSSEAPAFSEPMVLNVALPSFAGSLLQRQVHASKKTGTASFGFGTSVRNAPLGGTVSVQRYSSGAWRSASGNYAITARSTLPGANGSSSALPVGTHTVRLVIKDKAGSTLTAEKASTVRVLPAK